MVEGEEPASPVLAVTAALVLGSSADDEVDASADDEASDCDDDSALEDEPIAEGERGSTQADAQTSAAVHPPVRINIDPR